MGMASKKLFEEKPSSNQNIMKAGVGGGGVCVKTIGPIDRVDDAQYNSQLLRAIIDVGLFLTMILNNIGKLLIKFITTIRLWLAGYHRHESMAADAMIP
jgi:hypothetical protein